jgi:hypothetical protein
MPLIGITHFLSSRNHTVIFMASKLFQRHHTREQNAILESGQRADFQISPSDLPPLARLRVPHPYNIVNQKLQAYVHMSILLGSYLHELLAQRLDVQDTPPYLQAMSLFTHKAIVPQGHT